MKKKKEKERRKKKCICTGSNSHWYETGDIG